HPSRVEGHAAFLRESSPNTGAPPPLPVGARTTGAHSRAPSPSPPGEKVPEGRMRGTMRWSPARRGVSFRLSTFYRIGSLSAPWLSRRVTTSGADFRRRSRPAGAAAIRAPTLRPRLVNGSSRRASGARGEAESLGQRQGKIAEDLSR